MPVELSSYRIMLCLFQTSISLLTMTSPEFPLHGIIGIIANGVEEVQLAKQRNLSCVEMRPDLLLDKGHSQSDVMQIVREVKNAGLRCLFTLRRHDHGGKFNGSDHEQMEICLQAISAGADIVDIEWDSQCAQEIISKGVPTILSNHDFDGMLSDSSLQNITSTIAALNPAAIKVVPTATEFSDAVRMLQWVANSRNGIKRIGFAMGQAGEFSRILTCSFGGSITYATFDAPVAPGQIPIDTLQKRYRISEIDSSTKVIGIASQSSELDQSLEVLNQNYSSNGHNMIAVPVMLDNYACLEANAAFLRMEKLIVSEKLLPSLSQSIRASHSSTIVIDLNDGSAAPFENNFESLNL